MIVILAMAGCAWVTDVELDQRMDLDQDGYPNAQFGGADCDDGDAAIDPEAEDPVYDGTDSNCDGRATSTRTTTGTTPTRLAETTVTTRTRRSRRVRSTSRTTGSTRIAPARTSMRTGTATSRQSSALR